MSEMLQEYLAVARGEKKAELVLQEVRVVNVYSGEIFLTNLAIHRGRIIGWGNYQGECEVELHGRYVTPGLIDAHVHLESAMVLPDEFCRQVVARGVTTVAADPHELANVAGVKGIQFVRQYLRHLPLNLFIQLPSCVPATPTEETGARLEAEDLKPLKNLPGIHGLGEMMNFFGVVAGDSQVLAKLEMMKDKFLDGHAPMLEGNSLNAYVFTGIAADHETTGIEEAREKLRRGMYIMVREGSAAKDLTRLLPLIKEKNSRRFVFCTDDRHPADLVIEGHMDFVIRKAVEQGLHPVEAIRMATLNAAECLGLQDLGAIAPGMRADFVVVDDLYDFRAYQVYKDGELVAQNGTLTRQFKVEAEIQLKNTVQAAELSDADLQIPIGHRYRLLAVQEGQLVTKEVVQSVRMENGRILEPGVAKIIVVERYQRTGHVGIGLIKGFGLHTGALASSVSHDSHNLVAVGRDDASILAALQAIIETQGGLAVARDGKVQEVLPLPVGGLLSDQSLEGVVEKLQRLHHVAGELGNVLHDPFMTLSFMALPVIPELKMTTHGLFDVRINQLVNLVVE